ncbi:MULTISPECIES: helix-turn-helix domain-containing protein [unclassified Crossiella]|uniref:AraC-like ligand-binding domain-containing protein n=1 Tax=unclassified Crossiella TaxID=2620835 RepID=UPI001FFE82B9|nr:MULTISPECIES: helix-turn-helix domain-containing protein [unclassified Crossiella]MCK2237362.1 helix-turn-helix domain-containing protein [Crossiella sp. S99.2]MCK2251017.1 helix-turn-helix domain-containing protein [Crossiella sp. S99.1]
MPVLVHTSTVTERDRLDFWRDAGERAAMPIEITDARPGDFRARLRGQRFGAVQVNEITASPHIIRRARRGGETGTELCKTTLVAQGNCVLSQDGRRTELGPGDLVLYDGSRPYEMVMPEQVRLLVLQYPRRLLAGLDEYDRLRALRLPTSAGLGEVVAQLMRHVVSTMDETDGAAGVRLTDNLLDLLGVLLGEHLAPRSIEPDSARRALLLRVLSFVETQLHDPDLDPESIAAAHHVSTRYLHKLFQDRPESLAAYVRARRLERCRSDLRDVTQAGRPVAVLAAAWGFRDAAHFSKVFKNAYGLPPGEYRRSFTQRSQQRVP